MSVKVTDNSRQLKSERDNKVSLAIRFALEATQRFADPRTPKDEGNLRADVVKAVTGTSGSIIWDKRYAAAQEEGTTRGYPITNYTTSGTGKNYAKDAVKKAEDNRDAYLRMAGL